MFRWIKIIIIIYCLIGIALYYLQERFLFHPRPLDADHVFSFAQPFREQRIALNETDTIDLVQFFPGDSVRKGVVLYFHGNMDNVERYAPCAQSFTSKGYEVWMPDYPGYGKSRGERTEQKLYSLALQVQKMAVARYAADSIILYGRSLGSGIAAYAAANTRCRMLILETPYYSIPDLFSRYAFIYPTSAMSKYRLPTFEYLQDVHVPVVIFHGTEDGIIPYAAAKKLEKFLKLGDRFITVKGGTHNDLKDHPEYKHALDSLLSL